MKADKINKQYWANIESKEILSGQYFPEELIKLLAKGSYVLDVGCGDGKVSEYLYKNKYLVTGIDIKVNALEENRKRNSDITYIKADITEKLSFADSFFDAVVIPYVFVSIIDSKMAKKAAEELIRVLKNGGILWICEATYSKDYEERYKTGKEMTGLNNVAISVFKDGKNKGKVKRFIRHYSNKELDTLFQPLNKLSQKQVNLISPSSGM